MALPTPQSSLLHDGFHVTTDTSLIGRTIGNKTWVAHDLNATNTPNILAASNAIDGTSSGTGIFLFDATDVGADQRISVRFSGASIGSGILARYSKTARSGYMARYLGASSQYEIGRWNAGSYTVLASASSSAPASGSQFTFRLIGTALELFVNGSSVVSTTDATYSSAGYIGVRLGGTDTIYDFFAIPHLASSTAHNLSTVLGDWERSGTTWAQSQRTGSSLRTSHTGEYLTLTVSNPNGITGYLAVTADDDSTYERFDLYGGAYLLPIFFSPGSSSTRELKIILAGNDSSTDNWTTPTNAVRITALTTKTTDSLVAATPTSDQIVVIGDSISRGRAQTDDDYSLGMGALAWPYLLGGLLGADVDVIGFSGQGYTQAGAGNVVKVSSAIPNYRSGSARSTRTDVTHVFIAHGTNDGSAVEATVKADAEAAWDAARTLYPNARIYVVLPLGYSVNAASPSAVAVRDTRNGWISAAFTTWADGDSELIDLTSEVYGDSMPGPLSGGSNSYTTDLIHPNAATNAMIAEDIFNVLNGAPAATGAAAYYFIQLQAVL